jgi:hypothetical protein
MVCAYFVTLTAVLSYTRRYCHWTATETAQDLTRAYYFVPSAGFVEAASSVYSFIGFFRCSLNKVKFAHYMCVLLD